MTIKKIRDRLLNKRRDHTGKNKKHAFWPEPEKNEPDEKPIHLLSPAMVDFFSKKMNVRIEKAKQLLSYEPRFDFNAGMKLTEQWAHWANRMMD